MLEEEFSLVKDGINPPSRFLGEIDNNLIESNTERKEEQVHVTKEAVLRDEDVDYQVEIM